MKVRLGDYLSFSNKELNKKYCRSLHTCEWFPEENKLLKFPPIFGANYLHEPGKGFPKVLLLVLQQFIVAGNDSKMDQGWSSWFELFISSRECEGFPFLHRDMCSTHAFSMQIEGAQHSHKPPAPSVRAHFSWCARVRVRDSDALQSCALGACARARARSSRACVRACTFPCAYACARVHVLVSCARLRRCTRRTPAAAPLPPTGIKPFVVVVLIVCVCARARACACVYACVRACMRARARVPGIKRFVMFPPSDAEFLCDPPLPARARPRATGPRARVLRNSGSRRVALRPAPRSPRQTGGGSDLAGRPSA